MKGRPRSDRRGCLRVSHNSRSGHSVLSPDSALSSRPLLSVPTVRRLNSLVHTFCGRPPLSFLLSSARLMIPVLPSALPFFQDYSEGRRLGPARQRFVVDDNVDVHELFDSLAKWCGWGRKTIRTERAKVDADIQQYRATRQHSRRPYVLPSQLAFFEDGWTDKLGQVFIVNDRKDAMQNFKRLARHCGWSSEQKKEHRTNLLADIADHINERYDKLNGYRAIIKRYKTALHPLPVHHVYTEAEVDTFSLTRCKRIVGYDIHVNIYDFIGSRDRQFNSYTALKAYTTNGIGHRFPLRQAKENTVLKALLKTFH